MTRNRQSLVGVRRRSGGSVRVTLALIGSTLGALPGLSLAASFAPPVYWPAGPSPRGVVSADFDGDGNLDVAVVNTTAHSVSILLGDGGGNFAAPAATATGQEPVALAVADFNLDNDPDLATADALSGTASILFGASGAGFAPRVAYPVWPGPVSIAIGPGFWGVAPGIVTASANGKTSHYEGDGSGSLFWRTTGDAGPNPGGVAALDFNGDNVEDIIVAGADPAASPGTITLLAGYYEYYDRYWYYVREDLAAPTVPQAVTTVDLEGGSWPDLIVASAGPGSGMLSIWQGDGQSPYASRSDIPVDEPLTSVLAADLDGDLEPDLVAGGPTGAVAVFRNDGGGVALEQLLQLAEPVAGIAAGDFDQDGLPDLAVALPHSDRVALFRGSAVSGTAAEGTIPTDPILTAPILTAAPNPTRGRVLLTLRSPGATPREIVVQDVAGRLVRRLTAASDDASGLRFVWDLTDQRGDAAAPGVYFLTTTGSGGRAMSRITVLR